MKGHLATAQLLISRGVDPNAVDKVHTQLAYPPTPIFSHIDLILYIQLGRTPLHWAGRNKHVEVYHFLYDITNDVDLRDTYGITARYFFEGCRLSAEVDGVVVRSEGQSTPSRAPDQTAPTHNMESPTIPPDTPRLEQLSNLSLHCISLPSCSTSTDNGNGMDDMQLQCTSPLSTQAPTPTSAVYQSTLEDYSPTKEDIKGAERIAEDLVTAKDLTEVSLEWEADPCHVNRTDSRTHSTILSAAVQGDTKEGDGIRCGNGEDEEQTHRKNPAAYTLKQKALHIRRLTLLLFSSEEMLYEGVSGQGGEGGEMGGGCEEGHVRETLARRLHPSSTSDEVANQEDQHAADTTGSMTGSGEGNEADSSDVCSAQSLCGEEVIADDEDLETGGDDRLMYSCDEKAGEGGDFTLEGAVLGEVEVATPTYAHEGGHGECTDSVCGDSQLEETGSQDAATGKTKRGIWPQVKSLFRRHGSLGRREEITRESLEDSHDRSIHKSGHNETNTPVEDDDEAVLTWPDDGTSV